MFEADIKIPGKGTVTAHSHSGDTPVAGTTGQQNKSQACPHLLSAVTIAGGSFSDPFTLLPRGVDGLWKGFNSAKVGRDLLLCL